MKCSAEFHFDPTKPHKWYHVTCTNCGEFKHVNHRCFIPAVQPKEDTTQEDAFEDPMGFQNEDDDENVEKGPPPPPVLNFADIECSLTEERVFMPNLICWSSEEDDKIFHSDSIKDSLQAPEDLTEVEGDERPHKVITCFHNMHGFDGNFILEALYKQGRAVEKPLTQGAKILYFQPGNLIFKNSMNFFAMALDKFPSTFQIQELHKGFFPHAFNQECNFNYSGEYPPIAGYNPDDMDTKKWEQFLTWHRKLLKMHHSQRVQLVLAKRETRARSHWPGTPDWMERQ